MVDTREKGDAYPFEATYPTPVFKGVRGVQAFVIFAYFL